MAPQQQNSSLPPLTKEDLRDTYLAVAVTDHELQVQADVINLVEGRVPASSFSPEYLTTLKNYYRYRGNRATTNSGITFPRTSDTMDIV